MTRNLKTLLTALLMALLAPLTAQAQPQTLTVYDGDLYQIVAPANIYFFSDYTKTQFVIPADDLGAMAGGTISSMKFYTFPYNVPYTTGCPVDVYLKEVDYTTFDQNDPQFEPKATATVVYQGALEIVETGNGGELTITFSQPFPYTGGNLLVGMENTVKDAGKKTNIAFYGKMVMNSCVIGKSQTSLDDVPVSSDSPRSVIPKTTFFYTHSACDLPETLTAEGITAHETTLAWTGGSGTYNLEIKAEGGDWTRVLPETNTTSYTWENLSPGSYCQARVQSVCDNGVSGWKSLSFSAPYAEPHIIVYDGDESDVEAPAYIHKFRSYTKSQFVVPADNLGAMAGGTISSMKFYTTAQNIPYNTDCPVDVYVKEVDYTTFDQNYPQFEPQAGATVVYQGTLEIKETTRGGELTISFSTPYSYTGGNLLVSIENTEKGSEEKEIYFYGTSVTCASVYTSVADQSSFIYYVHTRDFVPKTTFFYTPIGCGTPETLTAGNITAHEATLAWTGGSGTYNLEIKAEGGDWTPVLTETDATTHTLENLVQDTEYQARVQSVCDDTVSLWKNVSFSTVVVCPKPADLTVTFTEGNGTEATLSWSENGGSTWQLCLNGDEDNLIVPDSNPYTLTGLIPNTAYTAKVRAYCDDTYQSHWSNTVAFTPAKDFLTVYDGNNNTALVPANICSFHNNTRSQFVIPAADLSKMAEGTISSMKFYTTAQNIPYNTDCPVDVYVKEVDYTTFDQNDPQFEPQAGATVVYQGILKIVETGNGGELTISFSQPYPYTGGNLLVSIENTEKGGFMDIHFLGTSIGAMGTAIADWSQYDLESGATIPEIIEFIPKTTFTYKSAICHAPTDLAVTLTEGDGTVATLDWTDNIVTTEWQICLNDDEDNLIVANSNPFTLTGLIPDSTYTAKVRAHCDDTGLSDWSNTVAFTPTNDKSLTVFESDDTEINMTVPAYINRFNYPTRSQFVIPDSTLSEMAGGTISSMKFYTRDGSYTTSSADVYLTEVDYTTFDGNNPQFEPKGSATIVYQGKLEIVQTGGYYDELTITFSTPYPYTGGNLLVGIENTNWQSGESKLIFFYGTIVQGASVAGYASSNPSNIRPTLRNFIPWTTFVYTPASCFPPQNITVGNRTHQTADVSWEGTLSNYAVRHREASGPWSEPTAVADTNMYRITGLTANTDYEVQMRSNLDGGYIWSEAVAFSTLAEGKYFIEEGDWCEAEKWVSNGLPTLADDVTLNANATVASGCVAEANSIDLNGNTLTIEDGGQLKTNQDVGATIKKGIAGYGDSTNKGNWYLIGFPTTADALQATDLGLVTTENDYDLYRWDFTEELEWLNCKGHGFGLESGSGILYANAADMEIVLSDTLNRSDDDRSETLDFAANGNYPLNGWNLLGNPFPCDVHVLDDATGDYMSFYRMNDDGDGLIAATGEVHPMEGFFTQATTTGQRIKLSRNAPQTRGNTLSINIFEADANRSGVSKSSTTAPTDRAIIRFGKDGILEKFSLSERTSKVYIPQGGKDYAVVNVCRDGVHTVSTMPVNFKAAKNGTYTLSFNLDNVEFDYLHLIDNLTGADVDLLVPEPDEGPATYTFTAKTTDYASRFRLVFSMGDNADNDGDNAPFAYINNGEIVITADAHGASLQLIDVMGRVVHCGDPRHCVSTARIPAGVYVLRLIGGEKVLTQKIVIH